MPIDASSNPYDGGLDPDDLTLAGKGAAAAAVTGKGLEAAEDDDLADAGKGAAPAGDATPFDSEGIGKDIGDDLESVDSPFDLSAGNDQASDLLDDDAGDLFDSKLDDGLDDADSDLLGDKLAGDDGGDDLFGAKTNVGELDDADDKDFDFDA